MYTWIHSSQGTNTDVLHWSTCIQKDYDNKHIGLSRFLRSKLNGNFCKLLYIQPII